MFSWLKSTTRAVEGIGNRIEADDLFWHRRHRQRRLIENGCLRRPDPSILSASIPVVFLGRNSDGLWVVRDAVGRRGGVFLFRASALRFARKLGGDEPPAILLDQFPIALDAGNAGNSPVSVLRRFGSLLSAIFARPERSQPMPGSPRVNRIRSKRSPVVKLAH
ncbi:MAG: hypothetical protein HXX15_12770 [Rhodopseudomonas sp.]|uniref:hypothetical protein n=1 Tax=Rhodopseudomonas sp. TaxID=1078 RepID=UPI00179DA549|nr:hypothetical protein [Rhodopseudomonas sp.]NVN86946.1 hypothetical protein [Rhodopseudomonas sp.]